MGFTRKLPLEGIHSPIPPLEGFQGDVYKEKSDSHATSLTSAQNRDSLMFISWTLRYQALVPQMAKLAQKRNLQM